MPTQIELLKKYKISIRGFSGQHFLIDPNIQRKIVDVLDPGPQDLILEIGPGLGALTGEILRRGARLWAVEKDARFIPILETEFAAGSGGRLRLVHADILKLDLQKIFDEGSGRRSKFKVISNLPYYITAPILFRLIEYRKGISKAVLTLQKEVAARLFAAPGSRDYGRLTLGVRFYAEVRQAFTIPPACFTPRPEVESAAVTLTFRQEAGLPKVSDRKFLFDMIRIAFSQRRKTLFHLLVQDKRLGGDRTRLEKIFQTAGLSRTARGEELMLKDYLTLTEILQKPPAKKTAG